MKNKIITLTFLFLFIVAPISVKANEQSDESLYSTEEVGEDYFFEGELADISLKHLGCVNSTSSCKRRANEHGYSHYKIQQDFYCPKTIYSCYGW